MTGTYRYDGGGIAAAELRFREDLWRTAPQDAVEEENIRGRRFGPVLATVFGGLPKSTLLNLVQGAAEPGALEDGHLAAAIEWVRAHEVDYLVSVAEDRPGAADAEAWLEARGYVRGPKVRRFAREAVECAGDGDGAVEVAELGELDTEGMSHIFGQALGLSSLATILLMGLPEHEGWHCYRANVDGSEVACGSMLVLDKVALLGLDATIESARGRGCETALITRRLADAARAGCEVVAAEVFEGLPAGVVAAANLERLGFTEIPAIVNWRRPSGIA